ncbi:unnamed protein product [Brassicogethes aeneus]|uniref:Helicase with zinc finger domain n=1 Tax=Brassicogethes aeneus TaxID=1431903 RepID=A0A9P0AQQ2_BRAAE|nr:unnamed protein product [Brassicogethes aeneus]
MEPQANKYLRQKEWSKALVVFTEILKNTELTEFDKIRYTLDHAECLFQMKNYRMVVESCKNIIHTSVDKIGGYQARKKLLHALFLMKRYSEAELIAKDWLIQVHQYEEHFSLKCTLEEIIVVLNFPAKHKNTEELFDSLQSKLDEIMRSHKSIIKSLPKIDKPPVSYNCIYCNVLFNDKAELRAHCQTETHETLVMSDEGRDWRWRPPPRGFKSDNYALCHNWRDAQSCRYGGQCVEAHGVDELKEWKQRFKYREMKLLRAKEKEMFGSYTEEFLERLIKSVNPGSIMKETIEEVEFSSTTPLTSTVLSKNSQHEWTLFINTKRPLKAVALLQDTYRNHFHLSGITIKTAEIDIKNDQEWISPLQMTEEYKFSIDYKVRVVFKTDIFGTFRQSIVFDFYTEPVLVKHLCVDVVPDSEIDKINEIRREITVSMSERWTPENCDIFRFNSKIIESGSSEEWEEGLKAVYPVPETGKFTLSACTVSEKKFTKNNYRNRMHELLFVEEMARYDLLAHYNLTTKLQITHSYILSPNSTASSTAKYSSDGELFASLPLGKLLSEDSSEGRLILMNCNMVYLCPVRAEPTGKRQIYEAWIEDKGKTTIYLRLPAEMVRKLNITTDYDFEAHIQFQLNRVPYCIWHYVLDKMSNFRSIFPETFVEPTIPWSPSRQWSKDLDARLNLKQKEAIVAITTPLDVVLPPILVIGPFGTGKTFTLAQAIKELIREPGNRVLLCTHSNSAADLYIKDYLHPLVEKGDENARPLRIYYRRRWVTTVNPIVQKYCTIKLVNGARSFQVPTLDEVTRHKIVVVTLQTSIYLSAMGVQQGHFTHILVDEAAQAAECETIMPLALANDHSRIVLAGDHMQLGPDIYSTFAKNRMFHLSLLERLYEHYPNGFPCKILLCENYRAHEDIIQFASESFYDQKLVSSSKQPKHAAYYPLTFFTTRGEDVQDNNSTAYYNVSEVYEVVERIAELVRTWPTDWGDFSDQSIGVVTPYGDQVYRIRSELRKRRIDNICVERVTNVQGKQFRAIILSTVRTRLTCRNDSIDWEYGFLSNTKLLNTAVTRAQSLVAVVGDPIALCSVGRCSKIWEKFIHTCNLNNSLFGITWKTLKFQLDGIELKKIYSLNPLAPEFYPKSYNGPKTDPSKVLLQSIPKIIPTGPAAFPFGFIPPMLIPPNIPRFPMFYNLRPPTPCNQILPAPMTSAFNPGLRILPNEIRPILPQIPMLPKPPQTFPVPQTSPPFYMNNNPPPILPQPPPQFHSNNKLIQFMSNVHFPEVPVGLNDCINLLPQSMSLADMLLQPPHLQEQWYQYLRETSGIEAAEKFKYLLHTTNQKGSRIPDNNIFGRSTPQNCESPTFSWYDSPNNQLNFNKPVYMRDNVPPAEAHHSVLPLPAPQQLQSQSHQPPPPHVNGNSNNVAHNGAMPEGSSFMFHVRRQEGDIQRLINEEFANLRIDNDVSSDVAYNNPFTCSQQDSSSHPRFWKYFN